MSGSPSRRARNAAPALLGALAVTLLLLVIAALLVRTRPAAMETPDAGVVLTPATRSASGESISKAELDEFLTGLSGLVADTSSEPVADSASLLPEAAPETSPPEPEVVEPPSPIEPEPEPEPTPIVEKPVVTPMPEVPTPVETHPSEKVAPRIEPDPVKVEKEPIAPPEPAKPQTPPKPKPKPEPKVVEKKPLEKPVTKKKEVSKKTAAPKPKKAKAAAPEKTTPQKKVASSTKTVGSKTKKDVGKMGQQPGLAAGQSKPGTQKANGGGQTAKKGAGGESPGDTRPVAVSAPRPSYPRSARKRGVEGWVKVRFQVDASGKVINTSVVQANPAGVFEKTVLKTLPRWRFKPGTSSGRPVTSWVVTTIRFRLVD